jgi:hypothetical protein
MKQTKILIQLPITMKARLDVVRTKGLTISGYVRSLLKRDLQKGQ